MNWFVLSCMLCGCLGNATPELTDKGQGVWVAVPAPAIDYRAVWGAHAADAFAVGDGIAHFDGNAWTLVDGVPAATYRAIWGRSSEQVWIGGDNVLVARSITGWQAQLVFDHDQPITEFSVLAIDGDLSGEYAVIRTGGQLLLVINRGSAWETPYWRAGSGLPFAALPSLHASGGRLVIAGDGTLHDVLTSTDLGVPMWESRPYFYDVDDGVTVLGGSAGEYVAAGPDHLVFRFGVDEPIAVREDRALAVRRDPHGVAMRDGRAFVVGERVALAAAPRTTRVVAASPIDACDLDGCALERIDNDPELPLVAVWSDDSGAIAVGNGWIVHRTRCGALLCDVD